MATSGHSGVDKLVKNLAPEIAIRGYCVEVLKIKNHGPYFDNIPEGVKIINLNCSHVYSSFFSLVKYLSKDPPDVLFTDKDRVNRTAILAKLITRAKTKLFVRCGTTISVNLKNRGPLERWLQKKSIGKLYRFADNVITTSLDAADDMSLYTGLERKHIQVVPPPAIPDSILTKDFSVPHHPWYKNKTAPIIVGVGELCMRKDFSTLIRAFKILLNSVDARLVILGKGKREKELRLLSEQLGIKDKVDFPGFVPDPYPYMAHADVFVHSSLWEGLSFVIIEALAVGTNVVATNCPGGSSEILQNGKYGKLVPLKNPEKMAEAVLETLKDPKDAKFLKNAVIQCTVSASTDAHLRVFGV